MCIILKRTLLIFIVGLFLINIGSADEVDQFVECPSTSDGFHPYCECKYGSKYDEATNTCPNAECPFNISTGMYPDCTCLQKNFDYSNYLNECFRFCPDNSSGYWPQCNCDTDGYVFDKSLFECITCPVGSGGQYPDCSCGENGGIYNIFNNLCEKCEDRSSGIFPNCLCSDDATYDTYVNRCVPSSNSELPTYECNSYKAQTSDDYGENGSSGLINPDNNCLRCPFGSDGIYPNCVCEGNSTYDNSSNVCNQCPFSSVGIYPNCVCDGRGSYNESSNFCNECPFESDGVYPNCTCENNGTYVMDSNWCYACPTDSTGEYPNCFCVSPFLYVNEGNLCVSCPENSSGIYPECRCKNGFFSKTHSTCIECPINSSGVYPDCKCQDKNVLFSAYINQCYIECTDDSSGIHPNCQCDGEYFYDVNNFTCKSNTGRICPRDSIGIGPDCLCMRKNNKFNSVLWNCIDPAASFGGFSGPSTSCPDNGGKWPQCEASIERNTLLSLIG